MQYSKSEIKSALHQNGGDLPKTLRFLSLYHEELAGVQYTFPSDTPDEFKNTWETYYNLPSTKQLLEPFVANETVLVGKLEEDLQLKSLNDFEKKVRSYYIEEFLSKNIVYGEKDIGNGRYGEVYLATSSDSDTVYAAKIMSDKRAYKRETEILSFVNKIDIQTRKSQNENVVGWFGSFAQIDSYVILTEFVEGDTLDKSKLSQWERWAHYPYIVHQLFSGLRFLHAKGVAHRDIKLQNVMLEPATAGSKGKLVVIDLGYGCFLGDEVPQELKKFECVESLLAGTDSYFSPQKASTLNVNVRKTDENKMAEEKADLWAAALTMVCFLTNIVAANALHMVLNMEGFKSGQWMESSDRIFQLALYEDETKLKQIQEDAKANLKLYYDSEIKYLIRPEKSAQFERDCTHVWENLSQVFSGYKNMTSNDILTLLDVQNYQDFFYISGEVKSDRRGLFKDEFV